MPAKNKVSLISISLHKLGAERRNHRVQQETNTPLLLEVSVKVVSAVWPMETAEISMGNGRDNY